MEKQIELEKDLTEIFDEEYEKRHLITPTNTAEKLSKIGYTKQEWISVEDRLPDKDELVLCIGAKGGMFLGEIKSFCSFDKSAYTYVPNSRGRRYAKYWMPLPQPPQVKGAE